MNRMTRRSSRKQLAGLAAVASIAVALVAPAPGNATAQRVGPKLTLGPTTILNGLAVLSGTVTEPSSRVELKVNGQPLDLSAAGRFAGVVNLSGQSALSLSLRNTETGESSTATIQLNTGLVGPGGILTPDALAALEHAAVSILAPAKGFASVDNEPIEVRGDVANRDKLVGLSVNGIDTLSTLGPNGTFHVSVLGTTKEISVVMIDSRSVSLDTRYQVVQQSRSVSAGEAQGVRIAKIRYFAKGIRRTRRLRIVVTVRDRRNVLIHGAVVTLRSARTGRIVGRSKMRRTNMNGKAKFLLGVRRAAFGKRNVFVTTAKTPHAKVTKRTTLRLPRPSSAKR
jgi:hypothetical protein